MAPRPEDTEAAARRAKKRELDRRAQRAARERTRSRIAYLEATVQAMTHQESSGRITSLMEQLADMTRQRDDLARTLSSIESTVRAHREAEKVMTSADPQHVADDSTQEQWLGSQNNILDASPLPADNMNMDLLTPGAANVDLATLPQNTFDIAAADFFDPMTPPAALSLPEPGIHEIAAIGSPSNDGTRVIVPEPDKPCDCLGSAARLGRPAFPNPSIWRSANEALSQPGLLSRQVLQYEDQLSEDIPIRVVLEGWDAVERSQTLPPLWKKLRRTDELQFSGCGKTERLAILRLMHRLLRCQAEPTADQHAKLPPWYLSRPAQALPHSSAIDFFVWPGVRERFIFSQHQYCSNFFWTVFTDNFRLLWPFEFRDCYKRNLDTGLYSLSPDFQGRIHEIGSWTMAPDFFQHFPEMYADIPVFQSIPAPIPSLLQRGRQRQRQRQNLRAIREIEYASKTGSSQTVFPPAFSADTEEEDWLQC